MNEQSVHSGVSFLTKLISTLVLLLCAALITVTSLHWGGMVLDVSIWLFPLGAALWLLILFASVRNIFRKVITGSWLEVFVLLWLVYALFSYLHSPAEYTARIEWLWILVYAGVFISLRNLVHSQRWHFWLLAVLLACATATCIFGLTHHESVYQIWGLNRPDYGPRISGTFGCPNHFGNFLAISGMAAIGLGFYNRLKWPLRLVCFYLFVMFSVGIFYSFSRGSTLAWTAGISMVTLFLFIDSRTPVKLKLVFLLAIVLGIAGCILVIANNEFAMSRVEQTMHGDIRLLLAEDALRIWGNNQLFGSGMATFDFWHQRLHQEAFYGRAIYTHNDYLNLLADYGAIGAVVVLFFFAALVARLWVRTRRELEPAEQQISVRIGWCVLAAMAVHCVVDFNLHIPACAIAFFSLMAIGSAQIKRRMANSFAAHAGSGALIISALLAIFFITTLTAKTWQSMNFFDQPEQQIVALSPEQVADDVRQLQHLDPANSEAFEKAGDVLRVKAAALNSKIKEARNANDDAAASKLLIEREILGQQALQYYSLSQAANPLYDNPLIKQALTLDTLQRYNEAYLFYQKALSNQPHNFFFHYYYAFHLVSIGEYELARKEFETAMHGTPVANEDRQIRALAEQALKALP